MSSKRCPLKFKDLVVQIISLSGLIPSLYTIYEPISEMISADVVKDTPISRQEALIDATIGLIFEVNQIVSTNTIPKETVISGEYARKSLLKYDSSQIVYQRYTIIKST
jgi:hypothetical protein